MNHAVISNCCIIILAAGGASRMGEPKLLLPFRGSSLLENAINAAKDSGMANILLVSGRWHESIEKIAARKEIVSVTNENWKNGISSSIRKGLNHALSTWPGTDGVLYMVADQPFVTGQLLAEIKDAQASSGLPAVGSGYGGTVGTPAIFHQSLFEEIQHLSGDHGARKILQNHKDQIGIVPFTAGETDIDTPADYVALVNAGKKKSS
ncbi:nucleotidyltransferase family protein [Pollutibacter soli]|uniref:nucleotidyltransferase family protein n=1 Tax=Pollutibacter soli TaxID=3034157 RepID=UPI003013CE4E